MIYPGLEKNRLTVSLLLLHVIVNDFRFRRNRFTGRINFKMNIDVHVKNDVHAFVFLLRIFKKFNDTTSFFVATITESVFDPGSDYITKNIYIKIDSNRTLDFII